MIRTLADILGGIAFLVGLVLILTLVVKHIRGGSRTNPWLADQKSLEQRGIKPNWTNKLSPDAFQGLMFLFMGVLRFESFLQRMS